MIRAILGVIAGILVTAVVTFIMEVIGHAVFPPPEGLSAKDTEAIKAYLETAPAGALYFVLASWTVGALSGTALTMVIAQGNRIAGTITAAAALAFIAITLAVIPHPAWMMASGIAAPALAALLAIWGLRPKEKKAAD